MLVSVEGKGLHGDSGVDIVDPHAEPDSRTSGVGRVNPLGTPTFNRANVQEDIGGQIMQVMKCSRMLRPKRCGNLVCFI